MNTLNMDYLEPAFTSNSIAIAATSSKEYMPYMSVWLQSIADHTTFTINYDIVIFERDIAEYDKIILKKTYSRPNISIRFFNPSSYFATTPLYISHPYFKEECYYRLTAPLVFRKYARLIFTDIDLIFLEDPNTLYNIDMADAVIAASEELILKDVKPNQLVILEHDMAQYLQDVIGLSEVTPYYNTGVLVINISLFLDGDYFNTLMQAITNYNFIYQEQCALNAIFKNKIYGLPTRWNCSNLSERLEKTLKPHNFKKYLIELENVCIPHYLGKTKPWVNKNTLFSPLWWMYARRTPYYEQILERYERINTPPPPTHTSSTKQSNPVYLYFKYIAYGVLASLSFGNTKKKLYKKRSRYKARIKQITNK